MNKKIYKYINIYLFQTHNSDVQLPAASMHIQQRFVNNKTADDTLADKYMKEWKPTGRFQCK